MTATIGLSLAGLFPFVFARQKGSYAHGREDPEVLLPDDKPKWDTPTNVVSSKLDQAGELAKKHGISPDRAQMLIDRYGQDLKQLEAAAKGAKVNP